MAQISLTLPDGNARQYDAGITAGDVAADISTSLGQKGDLCHRERRALGPAVADRRRRDIAINTMKDEEPALELVRHDLAHIMARAVQEIWPDVQGHHRPGDQRRLVLRL